MSSKNKRNILPQLRFSEFHNSPAWNVKHVGELLRIGNGRDYKHLAKGSIPVYGTGGYMLSVDDYLYDGESICIGRKGTIDKPIFLTGRFWTVDTLFYTHSFKECLPKFIYLLFQNISWLKYNAASGVPSLSKTTIEKIKVPVPDLLEQQKIADCLSSLDELITGESKKLDALKVYKKGLMQRFFPAEGENLPKLRFPEFRNTGSWEATLLANIANIIAGQSPAGKNYNDNGKGLPFYQGKTNFGEIYLCKPTTWTTEVTKIANPGDILISVRAPVGALNISKDKVCIGRGLASIQTKKNNKWFLYYFLNRVQNLIVCNGGAIFDSINKEQIEKIRISIPKSIEEQQKIADCLSSLDELITAESKKLDALKTYKKGLMQQLFPAMSEPQE